MMSMLHSLLLFVVAGLCEIGGGYLMWQWWLHGAALAVGAAGAALLAVYGVVPTYQAAPFGRVYAAYGGVFVVLSLAWRGGHRSRVPRSLRCGRRRVVPGRYRRDDVLAALTAPERSSLVDVG